MDIVVATKNPGKLSEIRKIIPETSGVKFSSLADFEDFPEIEETGTTFEENALIKAEFVSSQSGLAALGDDSGLEVDALDGRPGVYSARYGGKDLTDTDRCRLLLEEMKPFTLRKARFVCVMTLVFPDGKKFTSRGTIEGEIHTALQGSEGFGYDPIFYLPELKKTMAELPAEEKNRISHRAEALKEIKEILKKNE